MADDRQGWIFLSRELAADLLELVQAEVEETRDELGRVGRRGIKLAVLLVAVLCLLFWIVALIGYSMVSALALWLPAWGAGLVVAGVFLLAALILVFAMRSQARKLENPIDLVLRRLRDHLRWWREEVKLRRPEPPPELEPRALSTKEKENRR